MIEQTGRWLGIDFGLARIGLAVSDPSGTLARGMETIRWNGRDLAWALDRLTTLIAEQQIAGVVIGVPRRTDGQPGSLTGQVLALADDLAARTGIRPCLRDERYTTVIAGRYLKESRIKGTRQRSVIDQVAAEIILQEHLDSLRQAD
jgi:putative Holliday junction resolvase